MQQLSFQRMSLAAMACLPAWFLSAPAAFAAAVAAQPLAHYASDQQITEGQALLVEGKAEEALKIFEAADKASGGALETRVWVLRAWMDVGRLNDAFNEAEALQKEHGESPEIDYLFGYGSFQRASNLLKANGNPGLAFGDAISYLQAALDQKPDGFPDAWLTLAHSSWYALELDRAVSAIAKAVENHPNSAKVRSIEGEIHFSAYKDAVQRAGKDETAPKDHARKALAAFLRAGELTPKKVENATQQTAIWRQIGFVHAWLGDLPKASESFAEALSWDPTAVDYNLLWQTVVKNQDMKVFNATLARGLTGYKKRFGEESAGSATILWWLGYGQMTAGEHEKAEVSFRESVARNDEFLNSWFYVGLTQYHRANYEEACKAWLAYWDKNPASLVATIQGSEDHWMPIVKFAASKVTEDGYNSRGLPSLEIAERMTQVLSGVQPANGLHWNNLGLLRRDIASLKWRMRERNPITVRQALKIYDSSWNAYNKAVTLSPKDPGYLNDAAVILHYYLERDLDTAKEYYERAKREAQAMVDNESWNRMEEKLRAAEETRIRTALRDATVNLKKLEDGVVGEYAPKNSDDE